MSFTENRKIAWVALAVSILLSVFVLGGGALGRERGKVMKVFNDGADPSLPTRYSMDAYLDAEGEYAGVMANEAELRLGESDLINQALANAAVIGDAKTGLDARYKAYTDLKGQVEKLYNSMYGKVSDADFRDFKLAYDDYWGQDDMLKRDDYHKLAKGYNDLIAGFPGGVVASLTGRGALNTFGG